MQKVVDLQKGLVVGVLILFQMISIQLSSQNYWVYFTDKAGSAFDPETYFDALTLHKMEARGISPRSIYNYPVQQEYIQAVALHADSIGYASRWFNAVAVKASPEAILRIKQLPFVLDVEASVSDLPAEYAAFGDELVDYKEVGSVLTNQVAILGLNSWQACGMNGTGIRIAVFDGGFPNWKTHEVFEHLRQGNRILHTWDFTRNRENVDRGISHGTAVLSCIAGISNGNPMGLATGASFLLAITEVRTEPFSEEQNWLAAAEWAHQHGADIINSSLGYTNKRYFTDQMDGKTPFVTRAANRAAAQGMLVVNAAGNEGEGKWKIIGAPADGDSVLSVGGIDPSTYRHIDFSSYGPTFDQRMKPNVVAFGTAMAAGKKGMKEVSGTSFSSPLIAGFVACAWQSDTTLNNMELFRRIEEAGHLYPYYDYAHGYGIPRPDPFLPEECRVATEWLPAVEEEDVNLIMDSVAAMEAFMAAKALEEPVAEPDTIEEAPVAIEELTEEEEEWLWTEEQEWPEEEIAIEEEVVAESWIEVVDQPSDDYDEAPFFGFGGRAGISISYDENGLVKVRVNCLPDDFRFPTDQYVYLHIKDARGLVYRYFVFEIPYGSGDSPYPIIPENYILTLQEFESLCVHFRGVTECATMLNTDDE